MNTRLLILLTLAVSSAFAGDAPPAPSAAASAKDPFLDNLPTVEAAALHTQTIDEAPADVTIVTRAQIQTYGYRTLGEALSNVRGFYMSSDHLYSYAGVRGFSLPGDFNTRFLVMINGHPMTDNIFSSNGFFGQDFGLDMDLVQKIEVVRGPSSALYGSNGIFATINVVTVAPVEFPGAFATAEGGSFGQKKAMTAGSFYLGGGANLLVSASVVNNAGQDYYFPELDSPEFGGGHAIDMDSERAYHSFSDLTWRGWTVMAYFNGREKHAPLAWDYSANSFFSRGNRIFDSRNFVSADYTRSLGRGRLRWQISYDSYHYEDRWDFIEDSGVRDQRSYAQGDWLTSRATYRVGAGQLGDVTVGLEASADLRNLQYDREITPVEMQLLSISRPERGWAVLAQVEKRLSARWKLDYGARLDDSRYYNFFVSPRAALAFQSSPRTVYKFIFGRPFRNPNAYEQFYYDGVAFLKAPPLKPEIANTFEAKAEHHFTPNLSGSVSFFFYDLDRLIQAQYFDDGASQFINTSDSHSRGVDAEISGKPWPWLETTASVTWQRADVNGMTPTVNSPTHLAKFRWAVPVGRRVSLSGDFQYMGTRWTYNDGKVRSVLMADATVTVRRAVADMDLQMGVRNALNWAYQDPAGLSLDRFPGDPRSFYAKLVWHPGK